MKRKSWKDLSPVQRAAAIIAGSVQLVLLSLALWDIRRRPGDQIVGSKGMWVLISFINFVGPLAYFIFGRKRLPDLTRYIEL